jgi:glutamate synthase (NADPH/NADH) small chain
MAKTQRESIAPRLDKDARREKMTLAPQPVKSREAGIRLADFDETLLPFTAEEAMAEASRCLFCPGAPCANTCLLGNDIPGAMWLLSQGDFLGAAKLYRETSPMPEICGRICPQESLCEGACVLGKKGDPVALGRLEAFVADYERLTQGLPTDMAGPDTGRHVAIVGGGPAGIANAEWLRRAGHAVTIYEALPEPGGLLIYGIPGFKLNKAIVQAKVDRLRELGVNFICNVRVGEDISLNELRDKYDAVFLECRCEAAPRRHGHARRPSCHRVPDPGELTPCIPAGGSRR